MKGQREYAAHLDRKSNLYEIQARTMGAKDWGTWQRVGRLKFGSRHGLALYVKANFNADIKGD